MKKTGLYIHIPFCHARCGYCDFATFVHQDQLVQPYLSAIRREMTQYARPKIQTLFIGGGTPSVLNSNQVEYLFDSIRKNFDLSRLEEATVEVNPESINPENMRSYVENGINRVSIGLQTTNNAMLKKMDRLHTFEKFIEAYEIIGNAGVQNINIDLIYGLPGQTMQDWQTDLDTVTQLNPSHLSIYALKIEPGTPFYNAGINCDDDLQAEMYLESIKFLSKWGYDHYEISNFAKQGQACQHNLLYWRNDHFIGIGLSAASHLDGIRRQNSKGLKEYINDQEQDRPTRSDVTVLDKESKLKEEIMLQLRLKEGVPVPKIQKLNIDMVDSFLNTGLAVQQDGNYKLTPEGWLVSNQLFQHFV